MRKLLIFFLLIIPNLIYGQANLSLSGQTIISTYTTLHSSTTNFTCTNNVFQMSNGTGYMLNSGDEVAGADNNKLDGQIITGNNFHWTGTVTPENGSPPGPTTHGLFTGYNINAVIKYNYLNNIPSAIQMKSNGMTNTSGGVAYNVLNNIGLVGIPVKGMKNVLIYNNTFRSIQPFSSGGTTGVWRGIIDIYANTDEGQDPATSNSSGCKIKNNIFYTQYQIYNISIYEAVDTVGFRSDYNLFYCEAGSPRFYFLGSALNFAQWQALGYDKHSQVLNPNFTNTTDLLPSTRLNYGTTLTGFETGLSTTAAWVVNSAPATATQNGTWQVGARVYAATGVTTPSVTTNAVTAIASTTATCGGTVTQDGGATVIYRGVCWNTSTGPTNANSHTTDGTGVGSFTSSITGLTNGVTYYVRAYATNSAGTSYGGEASFTTTSNTGNTYYVAPSGSNGNAGTISSPWATIDYGMNHISAGDILYVRGGTYTPSAYIVVGNYCAAAANGKNGSAGSYYQVYNYPGETPVLDCSNVTGAGARVGIYINSSSYWHIKGIEVKNVSQTLDGAYVSRGFYFQNSSYCTAELINSHNNQALGMGAGTSNEILFLNCDSHDNYDPYTNTFPGDNADGYDLGFQSGGTIRCTGCRSWNNSDDGFDCYQGSGYHGIYVFTNCWSWHQGYRDDQYTKGGDGNGFKLGLDAETYNGSLTQRYLYNCIAYNNYAVGYSQQTANVKMVFYNNIAYHNGWQGFEFNYYNCADILRNNISYNNGSADIFQSSQTRTNNSFSTASNADFASISSSSLTASRRLDGSLPIISFMHLATGSSLIGAGYNTGQTYDGDGVAWNGVYDIGAFKYGGSPPPSLPTLTTTTITSITSTTAVSGGNISSDGGASITARGICWGIWPDPELAYDVVTTNGTGTGNFVSNIIGATPGTLYHVRAYATNSAGTAYGSDVTFTTSISSGPIYYVSASGNDSNNGTSTSTPWKTIAKVNASVFSPGDIILFRRGDTFYINDIIYPYAGNTNSPITFSSYGSGALPIISAYGKIPGWDTSGNWVNAGTNVWYYQLPGYLGYARIWINGVEATRAFSTTVTSSNVWYYQSSDRLYVYSTGNPATTFTKMEANIFDKVFYCNYGNITFSYLDIQAAHSCIRIANGASNILIDHCNIGYNSDGRGVNAGQAGFSSNNITVSNCTFDSNDKISYTGIEAQSSFAGIALGLGVDTWNIHDNTFKDWGHSGVDVEGLGYYAKNILIHHNYFTDPDIYYGRAIGFVVAATYGGGNKIYNNSIYSCPTQTQIEGEGVQVYYNIFNNNNRPSLITAKNWITGAALSLNNDLNVSINGMQIFNNIFANAYDYGIDFGPFDGTPPYTGANISNNIIYNCASSTRSSNYQLYIYDQVSMGANTWKNNLIYKSGVTNPIYYGNSATNTYPHTVASFNAENGTKGDVIQNNITGNPLFVSSSDFHLTVGSPAINAGISVGLTTDYDGNSIVGLPDIGAYEYTAVSNIPVTGITVAGAGGATTITSNGGTLQMSATVTPSNATNQTISWSVINGTGTATINNSGILQALTNGTVVVRATANDGSGIYGNVTITISNQVVLVTSISISGAGGATTISTNAGTLQFTTTITPGNATNQTVTWSVVIETGTATIDSYGLLTASGNGTVTVRATANDGNGAYDSKQITISNQSSGIVLAIDLHIAGTGGVSTITTNGGTLLMVVTDWHPATTTDKTVTWSVVNGTGTATISSGGILTALTNGTVTVWANANDGNGAYDFKVITITNQVVVPPPAKTKGVLTYQGKTMMYYGKVVIRR